jgi:hypothetical protein
MRRRKFIMLLGGAVAVWPIVARAQQPAKMKRIAFVHPTNKVGEISVSGRPYFRAFFEELSRLGYVEGQNLGVERCWTTSFSTFARRITSCSRRPSTAPPICTTKIAPDLVQIVTNWLLPEFGELRRF